MGDLHGRVARRRDFREIMMVVVNFRIQGDDIDTQDAHRTDSKWLVEGMPFYSFVELQRSGRCTPHSLVASEHNEEALQVFRASTLRHHGSEVGNANGKRLIGRRDLFSCGRLRIRVFRLGAAEALPKDHA